MGSQAWWLCLLHFVGEEMRGSDRAGEQGLTPCLMLGPSHCLLMVAVSSPSLCPYFQTGGRQRGRRETRQRASLRLGFCLETSTSPYCPPCPSSVPHVPIPSPLSRESRLSCESGMTSSCFASDLLCDPEPDLPLLWACGSQ